MKRLPIVTAAAALLTAAAASSCAFWRRKPKEPAAWTGPFNQATYRTFTGLVRAHFRQLGMEVTIDDGVVIIAGRDDRYGLQNLAQMCAQQDRRDWPEIIAMHFRMLQQAGSTAEGSPGLRLSYAEVESRLAVRLWPDEYLDEVGREHFVYREDLPGTITALVYDLPETVRNVQPADIAAWGRTEEELFAVGIDNLRRMPRPEIRRVELPDGPKVTVLSGPSFFVASEALRLDRFPGATGRHGAFVGVPNRHVLLSYPIEGPEATKATPSLVSAILGMYEEGPGSVSPNLYWYHDGGFAQVPFAIEGKGLKIALPEGLAELLRE